MCDMKVAIADYARGLAADPSNSALWAQQGLALESVGSSPEALTSYNQALTAVFICIHHTLHPTPVFTGLWLTQSVTAINCVQKVP